MRSACYLSIITLIGLFLGACGGGGGSSQVTGYSGVLAQAEISTTNQTSLSVAAASGTGRAIAEDAARQAALLRPSPATTTINNLIELLRQQLPTARRTANQIVLGVCASGSLDETVSPDGRQITMLFSNCVPINGNGEVINGVIIVIFDDFNSGAFTISFEGLTVTIAGQVYSVDMTIACDSVSCFWISDFAGADGRIYRIQAITVLEISGFYTVTATVFDPDHGFVDVQAFNIRLDACPGGVPAAGSVGMSGFNASSANLTFDSCDRFTVTVEGVAQTFLWEDYLG